MKEFDFLNKKIDKLQLSIDSLLKSMNHVEDHVEFCENTYDTVRAPADFILKKVSKLIGNNKAELKERPRLLKNETPVGNIEVVK